MDEHDQRYLPRSSFVHVRRRPTYTHDTESRFRCLFRASREPNAFRARSRTSNENFLKDCIISMFWTTLAPGCMPDNSCTVNRETMPTLSHAEAEAMAVAVWDVYSLCPASSTHLSRQFLAATMGLQVAWPRSRAMVGPRPCLIRHDQCSNVDVTTEALIRRYLEMQSSNASHARQLFVPIPCLGILVTNAGMRAPKLEIAMA